MSDALLGLPGRLGPLGAVGAHGRGRPLSGRAARKLGAAITAARSMPEPVAVVLVATATGLAAMLVSTLARTVIYLPLVLALPGYALSLATVPRALAFGPRLAFSLGFSLMLGAVGGLLLDLLPGGIHAGSWALLLAGVTVTASMVAHVRRRDQVGVQTRLPLGFDARQWLLIGLAGLVLLQAIGIARLGAAFQPTAGFTQLWIRPAEEGSQGAVSVGISNAERQATSYRLQVIVGGEVVEDWQGVRLEPGQHWGSSAVLPSGLAGTGSVAAVLYREDSPDTPFRRVMLWRERSSGARP